jgi:ketosteroid isomerase-like protein
MTKTMHVLIYVFMMLNFNSVFAQERPFVPAEFTVPTVLENQYFRIRMLTINDAIKDYDMNMSSIDHLHEMFPDWNWPTKDYTLEQALIDLGWHQREFQRRRSFVYTVISLDESKILGCVRIKPTTKSDYDADIDMWVRTSELDKGYDKILLNTVKGWIAKEWPFRKVAYPGREISWKEWRSMTSNTSMSTDEMKIREIRNQSNLAIANQDSIAIDNYWTDDFYLLTSRNYEIIGRENNRSSFIQEFKKKDVKYIRTPIQIEIFSDWNMASETGTWTGQWKESDGIVKFTGTYYAKWHKINGTWKIRGEIFTPLTCSGSTFCKLLPKLN